MPNPFRSIDEFGDALRKLLGEVADDPSVVRVAGVTEPGTPISEYPGLPFVARSMGRKALPPVGSGVAIVHPERLLSRMVWDVPEMGLNRLIGSPYQANRLSVQEPYLPVYIRPGDKVGKSEAIYIGPRAPVPEHLVPEVGVVQAGAGNDDLLRVLIHEVRHATTRPEVLRQQASRALTNVELPYMNNLAVRSVRGKRKYQSYLSEPSEQIAYLGEAGDDFRRVHGRPVATDYDAEQALQQMVDGGTHVLPEQGRMFYRDAFKKSRTAREKIMDVMGRVLSASPALLAGEEE